MNVLEKLPGMTDEALGNLHANAERLEQAGSAAQRASAAGLLPAIKAELAGRQAAKQERAAEARRKASEARATRKTRATAVAAD
jgi:hypothetical protein